MSIYFYYFPIIPPLGRAWPFIWTNLNPLHPGILCAKFGWNWPGGSGENENVKSLQTDRRTDKLTDRQTADDRWLEKLTWAFSSVELKTVKCMRMTWFNLFLVKHCRVELSVRQIYSHIIKTVKLVFNSLIASCQSIGISIEKQWRCQCAQ